MFTIEHEFDATTITLMDEASQSTAAPLQEDVVITAFAECFVVEQYNPKTDRTERVTLSQGQLRDLGAALDLPEGIYQLEPATRP